MMAKKNAASDLKLLHLVRKLVTESESTLPSSREEGGGEDVSLVARTDDIVLALQTSYREYQRKDLQRLRQQVQKALETISLGASKMKRSASLSSVPQNNKKRTRKRKIPVGLPSNDNGVVDDDVNVDGEMADEDSDYDQAATEQDSLADQWNAATGGGLNAAMRSGYRQQSQAAISNNTNNKSSGPSISEKNNDNGEQNDISGGIERNSTKATTNAKLEADSNQQPPMGTSTSTSGKRRRAKLRKASSRYIASTSPNYSAEAGGGGTLGGASPSFLTPQPCPTQRYSDLGGMDDVVQQLRQLVEYPCARPELYHHLGVDPVRGVLLTGPPGVGKTHLANAVAGELNSKYNASYFCVSAPELVSSMSGDSEGRIRDLFQAASAQAPAIIFLDEIDAVAGKRNDSSGRGMEKRMVAQLLTCMDLVAPDKNRNKATVVVLAATNRPDSLDPALRRAGRFDKEILISVPTEAARQAIIQSMTAGMRLSGDFDYKILARKTAGYVGADVRSLAKEAAVVAIHRIFQNVLETPETKLQQSQQLGDEGQQNEPGNKEMNNRSSLTIEKNNAGKGEGNVAVTAPLTPEMMDPLYVTQDDFLRAIPMVQPSSQREGFATVPDVTWEDIGALGNIREELTLSVLEPIRAPEKFQMLGLPLPAGVLLYGPPGCGKTLLAKAIAHESGANFISVKGPELLDKYVGESERAVRVVFQRARSSSPCVVFFDELDSLVPRRGGSDGGGGGVSERVVNQLLTEMDGLESRKSVFVIAATNRPELIDPAMMRPGRLDKLLYVPLPTPLDRVSILRALSTKVRLDDNVCLDSIGKSHRAAGYSGADCAALLREAGLAVLKEDATAHAAGRTNSISMKITNKHFDEAFLSVMPSVSKKDQARYDRIRDRMARARSRAVVEDSTENTSSSVGVAASGNSQHKGSAEAGTAL